MATRTPKKLAQSALSGSTATIYTCPSSTTAQIVEIWIANNHATIARTVTVYVHGTGSGNIIIPGLSIPALDFKVLDSTKIVLAAGETISMKEDTGTDVVVTLYGIEEA
jgi:hypothetical protein